MESEPIRFELPNGVRVIHSPAKGNIVHCAIMINAGTRDEEEENTGLAHLIEHCIFKGTKTKSSLSILNSIDSVGGELNAYTTKEETCVYVSCGASYFERALDLLSDITLNSRFPEKEIAKEKEVIFDEIQSYRDSPSEQIQDDFEAQIFRHHPLGRNILGEAEHMRKVESSALKTFVQKHYKGRKVVFSSSGNISERRLKQLCHKYLDKFGQAQEDDSRTPFTEYKPSNVQEVRDTHQAHCLLGNQAYSSGHKDRVALILLNNLLGGPAMNSRLNLGIREKYGITYSLESSYVPYSDDGIFSLYFGTDATQLGQTLSLVHKELKKLRDRKLTSTELDNAKEQLCGQVALSQEGRLSAVIGNAKNILTFDRTDTLAGWLKKIKRVPASQMLEIANEIFDEKKLSMLLFSKTVHP
jgi:predicted Zn-dependent peptidase